MHGVDSSGFAYGFWTTVLFGEGFYAYKNRVPAFIPWRGKKLRKATV